MEFDPLPPMDGKFNYIFFTPFLKDDSVHSYGCNYDDIVTRALQFTTGSLTLDGRKS